MAILGAGLGFGLGGDSSSLQAALTGADISIPAAPNPETGRWGFQRGPDGDVAFDSTGTHAVVTSVYEQREGYIFDRNHGSRLRETRNLTSRSPSLIEASVIEAIDPLEKDGTIATPTVVASEPPGSVGVISLRVGWQYMGGQPGQVELEV